MLRIISSNRQEALLDRLAERLRVPADGNPLAPEVVVAERGMNTWVFQQLAERHGIAANLEFLYPAAFVWQTLRAAVPDAPRQSAFDAAPLAWRVMRLLPAHLDQPAFAAIARYLADDADGRKRHQLAARIARALDDYLVYRPAMVLGWEAGRRSTESADEPWQMALWNAIVREAGTAHRAALLARFARLADAALAAVPLPARVSVFGVPALPPAYVEVLARLGEARDVDLYVLNPSEEFWGDLVDPRRLSRTAGAAAFAHDVPNRLLASWGQPVRFFLSELYGHRADYADAWPPEEEPRTLLARIQADIRALTETTDWPWRDGDASLRVANAWGPMREVEALHDWLLDRFQQDSTLHPREVAVYAPDLAAYAPYFAAVFGAAEGTARHLPWTLADVPLRASHPLLGVVEQLLRLPESRFAVSEVLGLLETPAVARRFRLDDADLSSLREALRVAHAHWGLDGAMRREAIGAAANGADGVAHTWEFALRRLFLGVAMAAQDAPVHGVVPAPLFEGQSAVALGRLQAFVDRLAYWRRALAADRAPVAFVRLVAELADDLLAPVAEDDEQALERLAAALAELDRETAEGAFDEPLPLAVLRDDLLARLAEGDGRGRLFDGRVTIGALTPMRSVPMRVVAVLGLGSEAFPRGEPAAGFDLVAQDPRPGDRARRLDDRHLFLETLLSARDALYLSYTGRSPKDGSEAQPSVVVSELIDYVVAMHGGESAREEVHRRLVVAHPLQPFSPHCFDGSDARLRTYDDDWVAPAARATAARADRRPFCAEPLDPPEAAPPRELTLESLIRFLRDPAAHFLRARLGVIARDEDEAASDDEPFALAGRESHRLAEEWLSRALAQVPAEAQRALLSGRGDLPEGPFGVQAWREIDKKVAPVLAAVGAQLADATTLAVDLPVAGARLSGTLRQVTPQGLVRLLVGSLGPRHLLAAWVEHLALLATAPAGVARQTLLVAPEASRRFGAVPDPTAELARLAGLYLEGLREPLPFFPQASHTWEASRGEEPPDGMDKVRGNVLKAWRRGESDRREAWRFEGERPANRIAWGHREDPFAPRFEALARTVYAPLLRALAAGEEA
jgi:exodeoxyribonuclease V gamma subunit